MCLVQMPHLRCNCFNLQCKLPWGYICSHCALLRCFLYVPYLFFVRYLDKVICVRCCRPFQPAGSPCGPGGGSCPAGDSYSPTPLLSPFTPPHHTTISPPHTTPQQVAATHHHTTTTPITIHAHQQMRTNNCQTKYNNKCIHKHLTLRNAADLN